MMVAMENTPHARIAAHLFTFATTEDGLRGELSGVDAETPAIGWHAVYMYVRGGSPAPEAIRRALAEQPSLRALFEDVIDTVAFGTSGVQAVADAGGLLQRRHGDGFRLELRPSRAEAQQVYVQIQLDRTTNEPPRTLFARRKDGPILDTAVRFEDGSLAQFLLQTKDPVYQLLTDPKARLTLA